MRHGILNQTSGRRAALRLTMLLLLLAGAIGRPMAAPAAAPSGGSSCLTGSLAPQAVSLASDPRDLSTTGYDFTPRPRLADAATSRPRAMVAEEYTATWCPYCYGAGRALDRLEEEIPHSDLVVVCYHVGDGYETSFGSSRQGVFGVDTIPTVWFNGMIRIVGGSTVYDGDDGINIYVDGYRAMLDAERQRAPGAGPFSILITGEMQNPNPAFDVEIHADNGTTETLNASVLVVEDKIPVDASNGQTEINNVMRAVLTTKSFKLTTPGTFYIHAIFNGTIKSVDNTKLKPVVLIYSGMSGKKEVYAGKVGFDRPKNAVRADWSLYQ